MLVVSAYGDYNLDSLMTKDEKKETGYNSLTAKQKKTLNAWISQHFSLIEQDEEKEEISLSVNLQSGSQLILSNGSKWEVDPKDRKLSSLWLTPFPIKIVPSSSSEYPFLLVNLYDTNEKVQAKRLPDSP